MISEICNASDIYYLSRDLHCIVSSKTITEVSQPISIAIYAPLNFLFTTQISDRGMNLYHYDWENSRPNIPTI